MKLVTMAYPFEIKDKFVEMRAAGVTLSKASNDLGIAYNTALNWEKDLAERIEAYKAIRIEELQEKYKISKEKRIELFDKDLLAINKELEKRDLSEVSTPKLFEMKIRCLKALEAEMEVPEFLSEKDIERKKMERIFANNRSTSGVSEDKRKSQPEIPTKIKLTWGKTLPAKPKIETTEP